jgi:hypothetical protein
MLKTQLLRLRQFLYNTAVFLKIVDPHDSNISLTNLCLIIMLYKLAAMQNMNAMDLGSFFVALTSYNYKRYVNKDNLMKAQQVLSTITTKSEIMTGETQQQ